MGILNATPDSFHAASRVGPQEMVDRVRAMLEAGADLIDIGGESSRPGAVPIGEQEELDRVIPVAELMSTRFPDVLWSIDTRRASVARAAVGHGASVVNDISAGTYDPDMLGVVAELHVPYILMHMQGESATMQQDPTYGHVVQEVAHFLTQRARLAREAGIPDIILDPGFGFGKTTAHNYALLRAMPVLSRLGHPVLVGLSRKRMVNEVLGTSPDEALNGTTVLNTIALLNGASILRVHDVREAQQAVRLVRPTPLHSRSTGGLRCWEGLYFR